jgi:hypothetical protein
MPFAQNQVRAHKRLGKEGTNGLLHGNLSRRKCIRSVSYDDIRVATVSCIHVVCS